MHTNMYIVWGKKEPLPTLPLFPYYPVPTIIQPASLSSHLTTPAHLLKTAMELIRTTSLLIPATPALKLCLDEGATASNHISRPLLHLPLSLAHVT